VGRALQAEGMASAKTLTIRQSLVFSMVDGRLWLGQNKAEDPSFFYLSVLWFELRALHLLRRPPALFHFSCCLNSTCLCLSHSWGDRCT
jgi:hypothetical protein